MRKQLKYPYYNKFAKKLPATSLPFYSLTFPVFLPHNLKPEMGIYQDNLLAIIISDNFSPIIVIAQNSFDLSITNIGFVIYFVIANKLLQ